jgi:hypothetical protein
MRTQERGYSIVSLPGREDIREDIDVHPGCTPRTLMLILSPQRLAIAVDWTAECDSAMLMEVRVEARLAQAAL